MSILSTAGQVTKAFRNAGRAREIVSTMSRFGFGALIDQIGLRGFRGSPTEERVEHASMPERVRLLFENLGPTFIKIGQVLSGRPDLIPEEFILEFQRLQDHAAPVPFSLLKDTLQKELNRNLDDMYSSFDSEPLASASIAQVHAARTLEGDDVVVKILKPETNRLLKQDLEILEIIAGLIERAIPEAKIFRPTYIVNEFKKSLLAETDFLKEASHIRRFRQNFSHSNFLIVPKVYSDLSTTSVLTLERLRGVKLSDQAGVREMGVDPKELLSKGMDTFLESILLHGLFHADPHGGNILVLPDGRLGLIDFGSVGFLTQKSQDAIVSMFLALVNEDYEALVQEYLYLSPAEEGSRSSKNIERIQSEVSSVFSPYHGLPIKEVPAGRLLLDATSIALRNKVQLPRDMVMVFRAIMTLEGIARSLDPDFDLLNSAVKFAKVALRTRYTPERLGKEALGLGKEWLRLLRITPRRFSEALRQMESGEFTIKVELNDFERFLKNQELASKRLNLSLLTSAAGLVAVLASFSNVLPLWFQSTLWIVAGVFGIGSLWRTLK